MKKCLLVMALIAVSLVMFTACVDSPEVYTVTFNSNTGASSTTTTQAFTEGTAQALSANAFTAPENMPAFKGWTSDSSKKDYSVDYDKSATTYYTNCENIIVTSNITLYALWGEKYEVGDTGPAGGIIFYDVDADNNSENDGRGPDDLSSATNEASGDMLANWRYLEAAKYDIKLTGNAIGLGTSNDRSMIPFAYYRAVGGKGSNMYVNGTEAYDAVDCTLTDKGTGASNTVKLVTAMGETGNQAFTSISSGDTETTSNYAANVCSKLSVGIYDDWFLPSLEELNLMYKNLQEEGFVNFGDNPYWSSSEDGTSTSLVYYLNFASGHQRDNSRGFGMCVRAIRAF